MGKKVTFTLPAEIVGEATSAVLLGELNDGRWVNDHKADNYVHISGYQVENCVISVPDEEEVDTETVANPAKAVKEKKTAKKAGKPSLTPDDLTKVEGIGKKVAALLAA